MPNETSPAPPPEEPQDQEGWHQLAEEAAQWPEDHEGLQQFRKNHVNRVLANQGLGHLTTSAVSKEDKAGARFFHKYGSVDKDEVDHVVGYMRQGGRAFQTKLVIALLPILILWLTLSTTAS